MASIPKSAMKTIVPEAAFSAFKASVNSRSLLPHGSPITSVIVPLETTEISDLA